MRAEFTKIIYKPLRYVIGILNTSEHIKYIENLKLLIVGMCNSKFVENAIAFRFVRVFSGNPYRRMEK